MRASFKSMWRPLVNTGNIFSGNKPIISLHISNTISFSFFPSLYNYLIISCEKNRHFSNFFKWFRKFKNLLISRCATRAQWLHRQNWINQVVGLIGSQNFLSVNIHAKYGRIVFVGQFVDEFDESSVLDVFNWCLISL
jgi:hypothetical protein